MRKNKRDLRHRRYVLDVELIAKSPVARKLNRNGLAALAGISSRSLDSIYAGKPITYSTASGLARALNVSVFALTEKFLGPWPEWVEIPDLSETHEEALIHALHSDMKGDHRQAAEICTRILRALPEKDYEHRAFMIVKLATILDNGGRHRAALNQLNTLFDDTALQNRCPERIALWGKYHQAIALRRLGRLDEAEIALQQLPKKKKHHLEASVYHQLGVVYLERAKKRKDTLAKALYYFRRSRALWKKDENHREGFSWRRIGQVHARMGQKLDSVRAYVNAFGIFASSQCARYFEEALVELCKLIHLSPSRKE